MGRLFWVFSIALCASLHAETYCFGYLVAHPDRKPLPEEQANEIQKKHIGHLERMAREGHLLAAGPLAAESRARGLVVYRCRTREEAEAWANADPAVQAKRLLVEMYLWPAQDGFGEPLASRLKADPKTPLNMVRLPFFTLWRTDKVAPPEALQAHVQWLAQLALDGATRASGDFTGSRDRISALVFRDMPADKARELCEQDPLVQQGYARLEPNTWFVANDAVPPPRPSKQ